MNLLTDPRYFALVRWLGTATVLLLLIKGFLWFVAPFVFIWAI